MKKMLVSGLVLALLVPGIAFSGNLADVTQAGNQDYANVGQNGADNTADVGQYGNGLKADVNQIGTSNEATVAQGADGAPVNSDPLVGYVSGAVIYQEGNANTASTTWHVGNLGTRISQIGDGNSGTQDLSGTSGYKAGKYAIDIQQVGDSNQASQTTGAKYGTYGIQDMLILQTGDSNFAEQTSISGISDGMTVIHTGNSNISTQYQDGMHDVATANVIGNSNNTLQNQVYTVWGLTDRTATIDILGDSNTVTQFQMGVSHVADIDIVGDGNMAVQNQLSGNNNVAMLTQNGDSNFASQLQTGNSNSSTVSQAGNANVVFVIQHN
jgi:minor curlin subunit